MSNSDSETCFLIALAACDFSLGFEYYTPSLETAKKKKKKERKKKSL